MYFQKNFLSFSPPHLSSFSHTRLNFSLLYSSYRIFLSECFVGNQEKRPLIVSPCILRSCRGCGLGEFAGSRVFFLRKQVRDLRVQEFLRELIVGVTAPSDLARFCKIDYSIEGGDVSKCARTSKQFSRICDCLSLTLSLSLTCVYISCILILFISLYA